VRFVLVKQVDERGFAFFTNFNSCKGRDLSANPRAAVGLYHWSSIGEQVRVEGSVVRVEEAEADRTSRLDRVAHSSERGLLRRVRRSTRVSAGEEPASVTERFAAQNKFATSTLGLASPWCRRFDSSSA